MSVIDKLAEQKMLAAIACGELDNLPGHGKPLVLDDDSAVPEELRAGYRLLKNAGYLPAELAHRKEIRRIEVLLQCVESDCEKKALMMKMCLLKDQLVRH